MCMSAIHQDHAHYPDLVHHAIFLWDVHRQVRHVSHSVGHEIWAEKADRQCDAWHLARLWPNSFTSVGFRGSRSTCAQQREQEPTVGLGSTSLGMGMPRTVRLESTHKAPVVQTQA